MKGRVLVVDDDKAMCELIETSLNMKEFVTTWCQSAKEANELLHQKEFDVVLTDVKMPGTTGLQLCQQISSSRPDIPVIVMTAFGTLDTAIATIQNEA